MLILLICLSPMRSRPIMNQTKNVVNVDVYYESLCSDSMRWIVNQFVPSYSELKRHIHVTLVPYGKATVSTIIS